MNHDISLALKEIFLSVLNETDVRNEIYNISSGVPKDDVNSKEFYGSGSVNQQTISSVIDKLSSVEERLSDLLLQVKNDNNNSLLQIKDEISVNNKNAENLMSASLSTLIEEKFKVSVKDTIDDYKRKNAELTEKINILAEENQILKEENADLKNKYEPVSEITDIYEKLNAFEGNTKSYIEQLCGSFDIYSIVSLGRDTNKIFQLWSYLKECAVSSETNSDKVEILNQYFEFCINAANSVKEQFEFYEIEPGSEFNRDTCIKTADSSQIGTITRIITKCVKSNNKVFYPAIVEIK